MRRATLALALALAMVAGALAQQAQPPQAKPAAAAAAPATKPKQAAPAPAPAPAAAQEEPLFETAEGVPNRPVGPPPSADEPPMAIADQELALEDVPRCDIAPGMYGCTVQGRLLPNTTAALTLTLPEETAAKSGGYRLLATLRTINGVADMTIASVERGTPASFDAPAATAYTTPGATEKFAELPPGVTQQNAGNKIFIGIGMASRPLFYTLRVSMPLASVTLDPEEQSAIKDLNDACCGQPALDRARQGTAGVSAGDFETADGKRTRTMCSKELPAAAADDHSPAEGMCSMSPSVCDAEGRLLTLSLPNAGLYCRGGLPESLGKLKRLQVLDLAFNDLDGQDIADIAKITSNMPDLERLFIRFTNIKGGAIPCDILRNNGKGSKGLKVLSVTGNAVGGTLPECLVSSPSLEELYATNTGIGGNFPDVVTDNSPLRVIYMLNFKPEENALIGPLPKSLLAAPNITAIDFTGQNFTGGVPELSPALTSLVINSNLLDGEIESEFPDGLEAVDLANNDLRGEVPALPEGMTDATLYRNAFTGPLPALPSTMVAFSAYGNEFDGEIPAELPGMLQFYDVSRNKLEGPLPEALPVATQLFQVGSNPGITGSIPDSYYANTFLQVLDVHNCSLTGPMAPAGQQGGQVGQRPRSAAQQQQPNPQQQPPKPQQQQPKPQPGGGGDKKPAPAAAAPAPAPAPAPAAGGRKRRLFQTVGDDAAAPAAPRSGGPVAQGARAPPSAAAGGGPVVASSSDPGMNSFATRRAPGTGSGGILLPAAWYLDLSGNQLEGPIPPSLAMRGRAAYMDLSRNPGATGTLDDFSSALASPLGPLTLSYLNVSNLPLSGSLPEALGQSSLFDRGTDAQLTPEQRQQRREAAEAAAAATGVQVGGSTVSSEAGALNAAGALGVARVLDASNSGLDAEFPMWLLKAVPATAKACECEVAVFLGGNAFVCPEGYQDAAKALSDEDGSLLKTAVRSGLECREGDRNGRVVNLAQYVPGTARLPQDGQAGGASSGSKRAGVIAGAVIGTLLALALIVGLCCCLCRRRRAKKAAAAAAAPGLQMSGWNGVATGVQGQQPLPGEGPGLSGLRGAAAPPAAPPPGVADYYTNPAAAPGTRVAPPAYGNGAAAPAAPGVGPSVLGSVGSGGAASAAGAGGAGAAAALPAEFANADPRARSAIEALNKNIASTQDPNV